MKKIALVPSTLSELNQIMYIIDDAKKQLRLNNVEQWQDGYPDINNIKADILSEQLYSIYLDNDLVGIIVIQYDIEPNYTSLLQGSWNNTSAPYATLHRVAINSNYSGQNLAYRTLEAVREKVLQQNIKNIRVDTHPTNTPMRHILNKSGYMEIGLVHVVYEQGELETIGFELNI